MPGPIPRRGYALSVFAAIALSALAGTAYAGPSGEIPVASAEAAASGESPTPFPADAKDDVVICEAGCRGDRREIVYMKPSAAPEHGTDGVLSSASVSNLIECVAGCYDTPKAYEAIAPVAGGQDSGSVALEATLEQSAPIKREPFSPLH